MNITKETMKLLKEQGYESLDNYFQSLADDYGITSESVYCLAAIYGESEMFDGLVVACEDAGDDCCY